MPAKVRLALVYVARGITPLSQWVVSSFTESSHLTFLSSASRSLISFRAVCCGPGWMSIAVPGPSALSIFWELFMMEYMGPLGLARLLTAQVVFRGLALDYGLKNGKDHIPASQQCFSEWNELLIYNNCRVLCVPYFHTQWCIVIPAKKLNHHFSFPPYTSFIIKSTGSSFPNISVPSFLWVVLWSADLLKTHTWIMLINSKMAFPTPASPTYILHYQMKLPHFWLPFTVSVSYSGILTLF